MLQSQIYLIVNLITFPAVSYIKFIFLTTSMQTREVLLNCY